MTWRVGLIDSCGGVAGIGAVASGDAPASGGAALTGGLCVVDAAAFVTARGRVERGAGLADPTGHGSRIARLISSGRAVELLLGQVFTSQGPTSGAAVAAAIEWALERGAGLIHLSLGLAGDREVLRRCVGRAIDAGCILVAAKPARGPTVYPAGYAQVIGGMGDARCGPHEISALGPWCFGACPRFEMSGGASIGAAWVTHAIVQQPVVTLPAVVAGLTARATYFGPERRTIG